jgi:DNA-binding MarR family transcriptional regulator
MNLTLTDLGKNEFLKLDNAVIVQIRQAFSNLSEEEYKTLIDSMHTIKSILKNR